MSFQSQGFTILQHLDWLFLYAQFSINGIEQDLFIHIKMLDIYRL